MKTFIDLFCGIGGFRLALESFGLSCVFSSEIDERAKGAYLKNFGELPAGDITKIDAGDIPRHDVLCAGFPCQPFSVSGQKAGLEDPRGNLFDEIIRIADYHKPSVMLLENVPNLASMNGGKLINGMRLSLEQIGYDVNLEILNAEDFGIAQSRKRLYITCIRRDSRLFMLDGSNRYAEVRLKDVLETSVNTRYASKGMHDRYIEYKNKRIVSRLIRDGGILTNKQKRDYDVGIVPKKFYQGYVVYSVDGVAPTQTRRANNGVYRIGNKLRFLSDVELRRVTGFPDHHVVSAGEEGRKQLGNAVCPAVIKDIYSRIQGRWQ